LGELRDVGKMVETVPSMVVIKDDVNVDGKAGLGVVEGD